MEKINVMQPTPKISIIIPVKNEERKIEKCIQGILNQTIPPHEIIVIDSGSSDKTIQILTKFPKVKLIQIPGNEFDHGLTRNLGINKSTGDFCLLTVGDSYACDKYWIESLIEGFLDEEIIAVCGQQVVEHIEENNPLQWFNPVSEPRLKKVQYSPKDWSKLSPSQKLKAISWDDVNAMYRRSALIEQPFVKTSYSEDAIWAKEALEKGHTLVYNPKSRVFHYHTEDYEYTFKRSLTTLYFRYRLTGNQPTGRNSIIEYAKIIYRLVFRYQGGINTKLIWVAYNFKRHAAKQRATRLFIKKLSTSEKHLDDFHTLICGKPPIPRKL